MGRFDERPHWYESLRVDPLKAKTFTDECAATIQTRALSPAEKQARFKRRTAWLGIGILAAGLVLFAGQREMLPSWFSFENKSTRAEKRIPMTFVSAVPQPLLPLQQRLSAKPVKSIPVSLDNSPGAVTIHLYEDQKNKEYVSAFLEDRGIWYSIGNVSNEGISNVEVSLGGPAGTHIEVKGAVVDWTMKLVWYNESASRWDLYDFEGHPTKSVDLDGDGVKEWTSPNERTVPPMVTIHRWNETSRLMESAQVDFDASKLYHMDREREITYSYLFQEKGKWIIEFGRGDEWRSFVQYQDGVLTEVKLDDDRSRLLAWRKQQGMAP